MYGHNRVVLNIYDNSQFDTQDTPFSSDYYGRYQRRALYQENY